MGSADSVLRTCQSSKGLLPCGSGIIFTCWASKSESSQHPGKLIGLIRFYLSLGIGMKEIFMYLHLTRPVSAMEGDELSRLIAMHVPVHTIR